MDAHGRDEHYVKAPLSDRLSAYHSFHRRTTLHRSGNTKFTLISLRASTSDVQCVMSSHCAPFPLVLWVSTLRTQNDT